MPYIRVQVASGQVHQLGIADTYEHTMQIIPPPEERIKLIDNGAQFLYPPSEVVSVSWVP